MTELRIASMLAACGLATLEAEGEWKVTEEDALSVLVELGDQVVGIERVSKLSLRGDFAVLHTAKDLHYLPIERLVGLKVAAAVAQGSRKRAGFV
jgi:hypothetical protein